MMTKGLQFPLAFTQTAERVYLLQCRNCGKVILAPEPLITYLWDLIMGEKSFLNAYITSLDLLDDIVKCCDAPDTTWKVDVQVLDLKEAKERLMQHGLIGKEEQNENKGDT